MIDVRKLIAGDTHDFDGPGAPEHLTDGELIDAVMKLDAICNSAACSGRPWTTHECVAFTYLFSFDHEHLQRFGHSFVKRGNLIRS